MKTITVVVGESRYAASLLSVAETARATRALGEQSAPRDGRNSPCPGEPNSR